MPQTPDRPRQDCTESRTPLAPFASPSLCTSEPGDQEDTQVQSWRRRSGFAVIGSTRAILAGMFPPRAEAHVVQYWRWKFLYERGLVDRASIVREGRNKGTKFVSEI